MKKYLFIFLSMFVLNAVAAAKSINFPNMDALGKKIGEDLNLFPEKIKGAIDPIQMAVMTYNNKINIIQLYYPPVIDLETIRNQLNTIYGKYKQPDQGPPNRPIAIWHLPDKVELQIKTLVGKVVELTYVTYRF